MNIINADNIELSSSTILIYCPPGGGKTTALGKSADRINEITGLKTLVLDVDRTTRVLKGNKNVDIVYIDNNVRQGGEEDKKTGTWNSWQNTLVELKKMKDSKEFPYGAICVDNISELERCILSDLGSQGKNKGIPAQADYQYMQFKLVNSLRFLKSLNCTIIWTAWETIEQFQNPDGSCYSRKFPKINTKVVDNICGLCDVVANLMVKSDGTRGFILESMQNVYAKNQVDDRKGCVVEDLIQ